VSESHSPLAEALLRRRAYALEPIAAALRTPNYFVTTARDLRAYAVRAPAAAELPFYLDLMAHLARHGIPCPAPIADWATATCRR